MWKSMSAKERDKREKRKTEKIKQVFHKKVMEK